MKKYKITVKHYLDSKKQKNGQYPVYVLLTHKRKVTRLKSAINTRFADETEMLTACKELIERETKLVEAKIRLGESLNPDYDLSDFAKFINENSVNGLEVLERQEPEYETAEKYGESTSPLN